MSACVCMCVVSFFDLCHHLSNNNNLQLFKIVVILFKLIRIIGKCIHLKEHFLLNTSNFFGKIKEVDEIHIFYSNTQGDLVNFRNEAAVHFGVFRHLKNC